MQVTWRLDPVGDAVTEERYCRRCGKMTSFRNSGRKRRNGNGHRIYEFAIFKCPRDHTWNKPMGIYAVSGTLSTDRQTEAKAPALAFREPSDAGVIDVADCRSEGIETVTITLVGGSGSMRMDQFLTARLQGVSRSQVAQWIGSKRVFLDGSICEKSTRVRCGQTIVLYLREY